MPRAGVFPQYGCTAVGMPAGGPEPSIRQTQEETQ
jgi:hypothetical protein